MDRPQVENRLALQALAHGPAATRWRTESFRSHASPRLIFVTRGTGRVTISGLTSGYGPNNLIFLPARTLWGIEILPTVFAQMLTIPAAMASEWPDDPVHLRMREVAAQKEFMTLLDQLERELRSDRPGHERAALYHAGLLAINFERQRAGHPPETRADTPTARLAAAYCDLVEREFRSRRGVADYAAMLGVTPTHLTRCCRAACGRSALAILTDRVHYEARLLLRDTSAPVKSIAETLGFASAAYFTRSFQAATGATPSAFRKAAA